MLYPQNDDCIVAVDSVTSLHRIHSVSYRIVSYRMSCLGAEGARFVVVERTVAAGGAPTSRPVSAGRRRAQPARLPGSERRQALHSAAAARVRRAEPGRLARHARVGRETGARRVALPFVGFFSRVRRRWRSA